MNNRLKVSIGIYILLTTILLMANPKWVMDKNKFKEFGTGNEKTILPLWLILFILAIFSFYLSQIIIFVNNK